MTPAEEALIRSLNEVFDREVTIGMRLTDDPRSGEIEKFCDHLTQLVAKIKIVHEEAPPASRPAILLGAQLAYCGIPSDNELSPFIEAVACLKTGAPDVDGAIVRRLRGIRPPAAMALYIAPSCTFCPTVVRRLFPLPFVVEGLRLEIVDGVFFREAAEKNKVRSVPTLILDGQYRWTGAVSLLQICEALENRDPEQLDKAALQALVTAGGAHDLAQMMLDSGRLFPAFVELLTEENFTVRLAAMVTMEELAAENLPLARQVLAPLRELYPRAVTTVKGDILYILGELKSSRSRPHLQSVLATEQNPEVLEAAREAIEKIDHS
ncbi:MAG: thioredoxin family protein [Desulfobacterales bacterium]